MVDADQQAERPTFHVDPAPVTVTVAVPKKTIDLGAALAVEDAGIADGERRRRKDADPR